MDRDFNAGVAAVMEEAERQQEQTAALLAALDSAIRHLSATASTLEAGAAARLKDEIAQLRQTAGAALAQPVAQAGSAAERATRAYQRAATWSMRRVAAMAFACFVCGIAAMVLTAWWILPNHGQLRSLQLRQEELTRTVAFLTDRGGDARLIRCLDQRKRERPCVQVDTDEGEFQGGYFIIKGY